MQSNRRSAYQSALETLRGLGLIYPCYLTRRELDTLLSAPHTQQQPTMASPHSPKRIVETDKILNQAEKEQRRKNGRGAAWRQRSALQDEAPREAHVASCFAAVLRGADMFVTQHVT